MLIKIASSQFKSLFTVHGDCSHKIKKALSPWKKNYDKP